MITGKILGDNGYACQRYLLTPVVNPLQRAEQRYNRAHKKTRNIIERMFGIWKQRFPCLKRGLLTKVETAIAVICATAVLHNIGTLHQEIFEEFVVDEDNHNNYEDNIIDNPNVNGLAMHSLLDILAIFKIFFVITV